MSATAMEIVKDQTAEQAEPIVANEKRERENSNGNGQRSDILSKLFIALLTFLLTYIAMQLGDIKRTSNETHDLQIRSAERENFKDKEMAVLTNRVDTIERGYQYNVLTRLTYIEAKTGYKAPTKGDDNDSHSTP